MSRKFGITAGFALFLFRIIGGGSGKALMGDVAEMYVAVLSEKGSFRANCWLWFQLLQSFPSAIFDRFNGSLAMFVNYCKVSVRYIVKHKTYSFINISGLALGLTCFTVFAAIAGINFHADTFHDHAENIYGVIHEYNRPGRGENSTLFVPGPLRQALLEEYNEFEDAVSIRYLPRFTVRRDDGIFYEDKMICVDSNFLTFFSFPLISGDPENMLSSPLSAVISEKIALKYFGDSNPVGKRLTVDSRLTVTVSGVMYDVNPMSSLNFEFLLSMDVAQGLLGPQDSWNENRFATFVRLREGMDHTLFEDRFSSFITRHMGTPPDAPEKMYLFPLLDFRLGSKGIYSRMTSTMKGDQYAFLFAGIILLLVVAVNFINLATARSMTRAREIGVRKVIGANRSQLVKQFLGETLLMALIAVPVSFVVYTLSIQGLNAWLKISTSGFPFTFLALPFLKWYILGAALFIGLLAGIYPAVYLSSFKPVQVMKEKYFSGKRGGKGRKTLVTFQFVLSIFLIVLSGTLSRQYNYLMQADMGYDRENILVIEAAGLVPEQRELIRNELLKLSEVITVSGTGEVPVRWDRSAYARQIDRPEDDQVRVLSYPVDYGLTELLGIGLAEGRRFSRQFSEDSGFMISRSAVERFSLDNPVGSRIVVDGKEGTVIGVVHNFQFEYIFHRYRPAVMFISDEINYLFVKYMPGTVQEKLITSIGHVWRNTADEFPFSCTTLEQHFDDGYRYIESIGKLGNITGYTAVIFSCIGLFGLISYVIERRTKEIGIRKVMGASVSGLTWITSKEFIQVVLIANLIALPIGYILSQQLLELAWSFRTNVGVGILVFAVCVTLILVAAAVISQTVKAARANPVDSLRYE